MDGNDIRKIPRVTPIGGGPGMHQDDISGVNGNPGLLEGLVQIRGGDIFSGFLIREIQGDSGGIA
jgi:hypothetical protein